MLMMEKQLDKIGEGGYNILAIFKSIFVTRRSPALPNGN